MTQPKMGALLGMGGLLLLAGASVVSAECGNVNNANAIDSGDAVLLASELGKTAANDNAAYCGGTGTVTCGDLDLDGLITAGDLVNLLTLLAGRETTIAPCTSPGTPECGATLSGTISTNRTIAGAPASCVTPCTIDGTVLVSPNVTLTFQQGVVCEASTTASTDSVLIFQRDSKINAVGTAADPILFTSDKALSQGGAGGDIEDWGGIVINGRAPVNFPGGTGQAEGLPPGVGIYGGTDPNDSSGVLRYVRIEFSGIEFSADNELNVLTMNGLGRGTTIEYVQANMGFDDCIEWFGGTVRSKYMVATNCRDDLFDWQIGFAGGMQYGLAYQNAAIASGSGRNGIEADNNEFGFNNSPRSNPSMCNLSVIGSNRQAGSASGRAGANFRRGTAGKVYNSLFMDWSGGALDVDNTETLAVSCDVGALKAAEPRLRVQSVKAFNNGADQSTGSATGGPAFCATADALYNAWGTATLIDPPLNTSLGTDPSLGGVAAGSPGGIVATFPTAVDNRFFPPIATLAASSCGLEADYFDAAPYIGAFEPGGADTAADWIDTPGGWIGFNVD